MKDEVRNQKAAKLAGHFQINVVKNINHTEFQFLNKLPSNSRHFGNISFFKRYFQISKRRTFCNYDMLQCYHCAVLGFRPTQFFLLHAQNTVHGSRDLVHPHVVEMQGGLLSQAHPVSLKICCGAAETSSGSTIGTRFCSYRLSSTHDPLGQERVGQCLSHTVI